MHTIVSLGNRNHFTMCCDFCAAPQYADGVKLIASPNGTHICQNCVATCGELVAEKGWGKHHATDAPEGET